MINRLTKERHTVADVAIRTLDGRPLIHQCHIRGINASATARKSLQDAIIDHDRKELKFLKTKRELTAIKEKEGV